MEIKMNENIFRRKRQEHLNTRQTGQIEPIDPIEPIEEYMPQHDQSDAFYDANEEMIKFAQMQKQPEVIDARSIKSKNTMTLKDLKDIGDNPSPKGKYGMLINGRMIDLRTLEDYSLMACGYKVLPTLYRYNSALLIDKMKGTERMMEHARKS